MDRFRIFSVDKTDHEWTAPAARACPNIELMTSDTTDKAVANRIVQLRSEFPGSLFAILDSGHSMDHVFQELMLLKEILRSGDYVVVEDGNVNGHPIFPSHGPGPWEAMKNTRLSIRTITR